MSSSRYWSHNSFSRAMDYLTKQIKPTWLNHLKINPIEYSEWSDTIYVSVEMRFSENTFEIQMLSSISEMEFQRMMSDYLKNYCFNYLNTRIGVKEFIKVPDSIYSNEMYNNRTTG